MINVFEEFKRLSPQIEAALEYTKGTHTLDDIWNGIVEGGDLEELLEMEKAVEAYASTIGCNSMSISGRRGWLKVFQNDGWQEVCTTIAKEL